MENKNMKTTITKISFIAAAALVFTSCTVITPVTASRAEIGSKRGVSKTGVFLGLELNKHYGIKEAAKNGKITSPVATVDQKTTSFLGLFKKKELIITAK